MDVIEIARICVRRWFVFVPIMVIAVAAGFAFSSGRPSSYTGIAGIALVPPKAQTSTGVNGTTPPLANQNPLYESGQGAILSSIASNFASRDTQLAVVPSGSHVKLSAAGPDDFGVVTMTAQGNQMAAVQASLNAAVEQSARVARTIQAQAGAAPGAMFTTLTTTPPQITMIEPPSAIKLIVAFGAVGVLAAAALSIAAERGLAARQRKRAETKGPLPPSRAPTTTVPGNVGPPVGANGSAARVVRRG